MIQAITESDVEKAALSLLSELGYKIIYGPDIAQDGIKPERRSYSEVFLIERLSRAIQKLNLSIPKDGKEQATKKVLRFESPHLVINNQNFHRMLIDGIDIEYRKHDGAIVGDKVWLIDFNNPENNEFLAVNQFTVIENNRTRRPDIVLFVNGIPLVVIELKNIADENATIWTAYNQLQTYMNQIPSLFVYNEILIVSDGVEARVGTISSGKEWFLSWKTIDGKEIAPPTKPQLEVLFKGMLQKKILLDLIKNFIFFEQRGSEPPNKILALYHQYHAVNKAVEATVKATSPKGDRRCGVIWHTQGSGKSYSMIFYAGKMVSRLNNPTIVVLSDRNDLDDQLFNTFSKCKELLRQEPKQANTRKELRTLLQVAAGGIIFTTIQKFYPEVKGDTYPLLSDRRNIVVIADEAHRSQYGLRAKITAKDDGAYISYGFAKHMRDALPNASFIAFTGTPIEKTDRNTIEVFGNYIDIYDIEQAVNDGATVRIYYESRLAKLELDPDERPKIDPEFEEVTEGEEIEEKEKLKSKWARLEAIVGSEKRLKQIAKDIIEHFEKRLEVLDGKGMIVCMSRRICVDLHDEIIKLRPKWYHIDDDKGFIKIIMSGSASDPVSWQEHIRNKQRRLFIRERMRRFKDPLKLIIVRDMLLTGFDAPSLHTMYIDKPMREHGLMQAIARVNRVFRDKQGGLVVDYIGIADDLKKALSIYTETGRKGRIAFDKEEAIHLMLEKYEIVTEIFHGFDYKHFFENPPKEKMSIIMAAMEHILKGGEENKKRFLDAVTKLMMAFSLAMPDERAIELRENIGFFQAVKSSIVKISRPPAKVQEELETAIKQIISDALVTGDVIDIFEAAGLKKPDISILSEDFLAEVKDLPQKNLAVELLRRLLNDEIKSRRRRYLVQARSFAAMLENVIRRHQNRTIEAAQVIEELIALAKQMREARNRGEKLNLTEEELAFYDALEINDSAVQVLGDQILRTIARELVKTVRKNISIDWTLRENVRAKIRILVKRILKKFGYPPDKQKKATETVLEQAALICKDLAENEIDKNKD
ncbi:MAG: type I restriction endonuclease subunit R [Candidatus Helarchaeota archaeon]